MGAQIMFKTAKIEPAQGHPNRKKRFFHNVIHRICGELVFLF
jgi:hypothetical protein